jgi:two-component system chemotaxis response regulator CheY
MADFGEILIVDDSSTSRMIIQRCIEMAGFSVGGFLFAENGLDAVAKVKDNPSLDLIVTDINMPKMDGQTLVRLIKGNAATSGIGLVVVSSIARGDAEAELFALGVNAVIKKPVSPEKMLKALDCVDGGGCDE